MFDPAQSVRLCDEISDEPLLANLAGITKAQRTALVTLLGGPAICRRGQWIVPELGAGWAVPARTMSALAAEGLVEIPNCPKPRASLTRRGLWYARTAAFREADARSTTGA